MKGKAHLRHVFRIEGTGRKSSTHHANSCAKAVAINRPLSDFVYSPFLFAIVSVLVTVCFSFAV